MNEFKEKLKIKEVYKENDFRKKVNLVIIEAIASIETSSKSEEIEKVEYMLNLKKIMENYEDLKPILIEYFKDEKWKDR